MWDEHVGKVELLVQVAGGMNEELARYVMRRLLEEPEIMVHCRPPRDQQLSWRYGLRGQEAVRGWALGVVGDWRGG